MRSMKNDSLIIAATVAAALWGAPAAAQQTVGFGTMAPGSLANVMMTGIVKMASTKEGVNGVIQTHAGPTQYLPLLNRGELDFANANAFDSYLGLQGVESFEGRPNQNLRVASVIFPLRQAIAVRKESGLRTLADLKGKRLTGEYQAMRTLQILLNSILATADMSMRDVTVVPVPNVLRGLEELGRGATDAAIGALAQPKIRELHTQIAGGIMFLPLGNRPGAEEAMQKIAPPSYFSEVTPGPQHPVIERPTVVQGYDYLLLTRATLADEVVYKVVKAMHESKPDLEAVHGAFREFEQAKMAKKNPVPYHPGAIKFYGEKGLWPPQG
ncbi:MAG: TAXI family TRAP transporter solute-binding subunit [Alphaproteobacteria bacterium]|nr:TAXI family TRAP transporter solute-binding subunit [Alphaproteobacteria bacterium]